MGINNFWEVIKGHEETVHLGHLAEEHYRTHGRPLRIAVDEADWRFNNLTAAQVYAIRETSDQPAFQGIEKLIFYRICRILTLNVDLLFVFDGPRRPWKRNKRGGKIDYEKRKLLKEMLRYFRVPSHEAPGEAEAECARLQLLGVVDAVWSQDSDTLMFGCDFLIRDHRVAKDNGQRDRSKENTKKDGKTVQVIRGRKIENAFGFNRDGLVLFVMLAGGDYDTRGLPGCGQQKALTAVAAGLGTTLRQCRSAVDCRKWREDLTDHFKGRIMVPLDYPDVKTLTKYNCPTISTDEQLLNLHGLRNGWRQDIREAELLKFTGERFNYWGKGYMKWIAPILLVRAFVSGKHITATQNLYQIELKRQIKTKREQGVKTLERKLTFSPWGVSNLSPSNFTGDQTGWWTGAKNEPFDPDHLVECEILDSLLRVALPSNMLDPPSKETPQKRQRRDSMEYDISTTTGSKSKRRARIPAQQRQRHDLKPNLSDDCISEVSMPTTSSTKPGKQALRDPDHKKLTSSAIFVDLLSDSDDGILEDIVISASKSGFKAAGTVDLGLQTSSTPKYVSTQIASSNLIDLGSCSEGSASDGYDNDISDDQRRSKAIRPSLLDSAQTSAQSSQAKETPPYDILRSSTSGRPAVDFVGKNSPPHTAKRTPSLGSPSGRINEVSRKTSDLYPQSGMRDTLSTDGSRDDRSAPTSASIPEWSFHPPGPAAGSSSSRRHDRFPIPLPSKPYGLREPEEPKDRHQIRAARLRHFEDKITGGNPKPQPHLTNTLQEKSSPETRIASPVVSKNMQEIEYIDLTDL